jgi:drug/metabolite transporter (DMT)-like permease
MLSLALGLAASVAWAVTNICLSLLATRADARDTAFWVFAFELLLLGPMVAISGDATMSGHDAFWLSVAGTSAAAGLIVLSTALEQGQIGTVAPLVAMEGPFAVIAGILGGKAASISVILGGALAGVGGVLIALHRRPGGPSAAPAVAKSSLLAMCTAALFGVSLWALAWQSSPFATSMFLFRIVGIGAIFLALRRLPRPPKDLRWPVFAAISDIAGTALFLAGVRGGSLSVAAVAATQFGSFAAIFGFLAWKETLTARQVLGVAILGVGIAVVAVGAA